MQITRAQWPHSINDILQSLEGIWGLVGATGTNGNLFRLEKSLHEPFTYTLVEYIDNNEGKVSSKKTYAFTQRQEAINDFARAIGFVV